MLICNCNKTAYLCTYHRKNKGTARGVIGLLAYGKITNADDINNADDIKESDSTTNSINSYVNKFNDRSLKWINNGLYEHLHLCKGSDMATALLAVNKHDLFGNLKKEDIVCSKNHSKNTKYITDRITEIAQNRIPFIFDAAKLARSKYGNSSEIDIYTRVSWALAGLPNSGKTTECGILLDLLRIFEENPDTAVILQVAIPDGSVNNNKRYWDIEFNVSCYGKIEQGESKLTAVYRETAEEIDLNIYEYKDIISGTWEVYFVNMLSFKFYNYFHKEEKKWTGIKSCETCFYRNQNHRAQASI